MLMTMELWEIGFYVHPLKLALLLLVSLPLLTGLSWISGFEPTSSLGDRIVDAFAAIFVAALMSVVILALFGVIGPDMPLREIIGKVSLQTFAGSFGAELARSQLSGGSPTAEREQRSYPATLLVMAAGAIFLGLNTAPTEEIILISYMMGPWREISLIVLSIALMHGFVYAVSFRGEPQRAPGATFWMLFLRYSIVGYALVLAISLYLLWTFGRTDGTGVEETVSACVVLGFPCAIGAAASRLIL